MGYGMKRVTTPQTGVTQGDATTPKNRCVTTTTPKGGWGGGDAASPVSPEVEQLADIWQAISRLEDRLDALTWGGLTRQCWNLGRNAREAERRETQAKIQRQIPVFSSPARQDHLIYSHNA